MIEFGGHGKERKRSGLIKDVSLLSKGKSLEECLQAQQEWLKKKGQAAEADVASGVDDTKVLMTSYVEDNTSRGKVWIFDLGSTFHVCSQKELFNFLVAKEEGTVKMVDGSACEVIDTVTVKITERDVTMHALEVVWYVSEARYNLNL